jgi:hypothetical protein
MLSEAEELELLELEEQEYQVSKTQAAATLGVGKTEEKGILDSIKETIEDGSRAFSQGMPGYGLVQKAGAGGRALIEEGFEALGNDRVGKKSLSERYEQALAEDMQADVEASDRSPIVTTGGQIAGGIATPGVKGSKGLMGVAQRVAGNAAINAADMGTRGKDLVDEDKAVEGGLMSAGFSAVAESLPYVGKGIKKLGRLLPGTENALPYVNNKASKYASLMPWSDVDADDLEKLMNNPAGRREARSAKVKNSIEPFTEQSAKALGAIDKLTDAQMQKVYEHQEHMLKNTVSGQEITQAAQETIDRLKQTVEARPEFFGRAGKVVNQVDDILKRGGASEIGEATQDMPYQFLVKNFSDKDAAGTYVQRLLDARRHIDDVTKNVDFDKMLKSEKDMILKARQSINDQFDGMESAKPLRMMDKYFSEYTAKKKNALRNLETPLPSGEREFTPEKVLQFFKSEAGQSKFIDRSLGEFADHMSILKSMKGAEMTGEIVKQLNGAREVFKMLKGIEDLNRTSGGPSSQAINGLMQFLIGGATSGATLLLMPITNPAAWLKLIDKTSESTEKAFLEKITKKASELAKQYPAYAARIYSLNKMQDKQEEEKR